MQLAKSMQLHDELKSGSRDPRLSGGLRDHFVGKLNSKTKLILDPAPSNSKIQTGLLPYVIRSTSPRQGSSKKMILRLQTRSGRNSWGKTNSKSAKQRNMVVQRV
eukprot:10399973-Prorocentrum_lima.AAC.1